MSSNVRLRKVSNRNQLEEKIDDYQIQGYTVKERSEKHGLLQNSDWGSGSVHFLVFVLTVWWSLGIGNLVYLLYAYLVKSKQIMIKVSDS